jgi:hypothetical protein
MKLIISLLLLLLFAASVLAWQAKPRVCSLDAGLLQKSKAQLNAKTLRSLLCAALLTRRLTPGHWLSLRKSARHRVATNTITFRLRPIGGLTPKSKDGLPYIRRDGEVFPDSKRGTDANVIGAMAGAVEALAITYYFTGEERYAERAALLVRAWFLDPATRMNPNFRYAQAVLGQNEGRGAGLIESRQFIKIVDAVGLLGGSRAWAAKDQQALSAWFREFINWMQTSPNGKDEAKAKNNHGSWYAAQLACFALFIGDQELARKTAEAAKARIAWQVEPDGNQPEELQRTRGLWYSGFNLEALMTLAEAGKQVGVDLYAYQTKDGRSMRRALDYLAPFADPASQWPHQQINELESARRELAYVLRRASIAYREPKYEELLAKHLVKEAEQQQWQLLWPR